MSENVVRCDVEATCTIGSGCVKITNDKWVSHFKVLWCEGEKHLKLDWDDMAKRVPKEVLPPVEEFRGARRLTQRRGGLAGRRRGRGGRGGVGPW